MDSEIKFKVINSNLVHNLGIVTELENVMMGIPQNGILKSLNSNLFWEVESRIIEYNPEKRFEDENELFVHSNISSFKTDFSDIIKLRKEKNICVYNLKPIGHNSKPQIGENLVFHATTFRKKIKIIEIYENYFLLKNNDGYKAIIPKRKVLRSKTAEIGDYVRHCEHQYHDLVDENENFVYRD